MKTKAIVKFGLLGVVVVALLAASWFLPVGDWVKSFSDWVEQRGALGIVWFILGYALGTVLFVPGALLTIASGIVFGLWGAPIALIGATLGATLSFLIGRYVARDAVRSWLEGHPKFKAFDEAIGREDWKVIGLLRLSPVVPFSLSNYAFGVSKARLMAYVLASLVCMAPGAFLYAYLGHAGMLALGESASKPGTLQIVFYAVGFVATVALTWYLTRLARKQLKD